jgi:phenylacetate-CoA ligase
LNDNLLKFYYYMPPFFRSIFASLHGFYLKSWRYNSKTEEFIEATLEREHWSSKQWKLWRENQLSLVLHRAATQVPYYREQWARRRRHGDRASWEYLENWPILDKETVQQNSTAFVADDCNINNMYCDHTSGTTGKPLEIWIDRKTVQVWYAIFEARCRRWHGVSRHDRWAILGGRLIAQVNLRKPPFWIWNAGLNQLYMSSYHLSPDLIIYYLDALKHYNIKYILGYTSSLYALAQVVLERRRTDLKMAVVITNAEPVYKYQKNLIARAFQCQVRETYGMAEIVAAACECKSDQLHLWPEIGWVEVMDEDQPVAHGFSGEFVSTGLLNIDMPLIRYRTGDRGIKATLNKSCDCGRNLPLLSSIEGRVDDILYTTDDRYIGRLDPVFKANLPIREAQIIQEALDRIRVRYVPAPGFTPESGRSIVRRLHERLGIVQVLLEQVDEVPREANGKFRAVISRLTD